VLPFSPSVCGPSWRSSSRDLPGGAPSAEGDASAEHTRAPVHPAQHHRHRAAYGIDHVEQLPFSGSTNANQALVDANQQTLNNVRLWTRTPDRPATFQKVQDIRQYYTFQSLGVDRYTIGGSSLRRWSACASSTRTASDNSWSTPSAVHARHRHGARSGEPDHANGYPTSPSPMCPGFLGWLAEPHPADVYFGLNDPGTSWPTRSSGAQLPGRRRNDVETHYSGPAVSPWAAPSPARVRVAARGLQPLDLELITLSRASCSCATSSRWPRSGALLELRR